MWCWHHIMDMAEKDETEGRCPACRSIYEKEKVVATQTNFERSISSFTNLFFSLGSELLYNALFANRVTNCHANGKNKPPKAKPKTNEVKKDLTNVRVIQRKMAYVIGLPLSLANEDVWGLILYFVLLKFLVLFFYLNKWIIDQYCFVLFLFFDKVEKSGFIYVSE